MLLGDVDELDGGVVKGALVVAVALPVGVGLLDDDLALFAQPLEHQVDVELLGVGAAHAEGDVLEIAEHRDLALVARRGAFLGQIEVENHLLGRPGLGFLGGAAPRGAVAFRLLAFLVMSVSGALLPSGLLRVCRPRLVLRFFLRLRLAAAALLALRFGLPAALLLFGGGLRGLDAGVVLRRPAEHERPYVVLLVVRGLRLDPDGLESVLVDLDLVFVALVLART